ncbi:hypothetical protein [Legionella bozemanae]|uniref:hypothetical protein n=1 Tax=Legionella bozemanae TaxID=447 RepID=UPI0010411E7E|nr:hypothetical protein [Legionella bozemanae]
MTTEKLDKATPQTFVDALRQGDFTLAACFEDWARKKYPKIAGTGLPEDISPLIGILLAQTDFSKEDAVPLMAAYESSESIFQAKMLAIYGGVETYLSLKDKSDVVNNKFTDILATERPNEELHNYIDQNSHIPAIVTVEDNALPAAVIKFKAKNQETIKQIQDRAAYLYKMYSVADDYRLSLEKMEVHSKESRESHSKVKEMMDILSTASLYSGNELMKELDERVTYLKEHGPESEAKKALISLFTVPKEYEEIKTKIVDYLTILHNNPVKEPEKNPKLAIAYNNRLRAGQNMLLSLYQGKSRQEVMQDLEQHTKTIEKNKPGLVELGFLGWIKNKLGMNKELSIESEKFKEAKQKLQESRKADKEESGPSNLLNQGKVL